MIYLILLLYIKSYFHGCMHCYKPDTFNELLQDFMINIYDSHKKRIELIKREVNVVEIWECQFEQMLKYDNDLKKFLTFHNFNLFFDDIKPRDSLYGGRVNAAKLYYKISGNEKIKHYDIRSLYPYVQKYKEFPVGHPIIIKNDFKKTIESYFGLISCTVTPPRLLLFPVLPIKLNGKLLFTLCFTCAKYNLNMCNHTDEERELSGTWVSHELIEAIKFGYKIKSIKTVWHWETTSKIFQNGIFTEYIDLFLKYKQESSGFPNYIEQETNSFKKEQLIVEYINRFEQHESIKLDRSKIKINEGIRSMSKLMLNSFWGKYAQNPDKVHYKLLNSHSELMNYILNDKYKIQKMIFNDNLCQLYYKNNDLDYINTLGNVVIGAFVTAHANI